MAAKKTILEQALDNKPLMYIAGGVLAYNFLIKPLLIKVGLKKSDEEIYNDAAGVTASPWSATYWRQSTDPVFGGQVEEGWMDDLVNQLYHSFTTFHDDFGTILTVFKQMTTQRQVSFLCEYFSITYKQDLYTFLKTGGEGGTFWGASGAWPFSIWDGLSTSQLTELNTYVNSLPAA